MIVSVLSATETATDPRSSLGWQVSRLSGSGRVRDNKGRGRRSPLVEPGRYNDDFERLFDAHYDAVLRYCLRRSHYGDAADVAAQVFAVAWRKLADAPDSQYLLPWLYRIARYELSTSRRTLRRLGALREKLNGLAPAPSTGPESVVVQSAEQQVIVRALDELSTSDREVIMLKCYEEMSTREMAVVLDCSEDAAKKRLSRALHRLRNELGVDSSRRPDQRSSEVTDERSTPPGGGGSHQPVPESQSGEHDRRTRTGTRQSTEQSRTRRHRVRKRSRRGRASTPAARVAAGPGCPVWHRCRGSSIGIRSAQPGTHRSG